MAQTASKHAPWYLIPANSKPYGRIAAFRILVDRMGKGVQLEPRPIDPGILERAERTLHLSAYDVARASDLAKRKPKRKTVARDL